MGIVLVLLILILIIASIWKIYEKAGRQGWEGIIPIYNNWVLAEIVGKPGWYGLLTLIPVIGAIVAIYLIYLLAKSFGKGGGYALGMIFLGIIFFPMLAFGDAKYQGPPKDEIMGNLEE